MEVREVKLVAIHELGSEEDIQFPTNYHWLEIQATKRHEVEHGYRKGYYEVGGMVFQVEDGVGNLLSLLG
jgi:hypothetical protein